MSRAPGEVDKIVGQNIRIFRLARGFSQTKLATSVGLSFQQVQKYEKGTNRVGSSVLVKIAEALDTPVVRFFDNRASGIEDGIPADILTGLLATPDGIRMLRALSKVTNAKVRRSLVLLAETITSSRDG
jgi:transcriptional regulator with XRE-family HTH domain